MYLPKRREVPRHNPFKVQYSMRFMYASGVITAFAAFISFFYVAQQAQQRERRTQRELRIQRPGQRVVIVGAGPGGSALAASLCNANPDIHVTVVERDKKQVFLGAVPLAHVGHRSYDLNTTGGVDFLRSPASWNVTREAHLVSGEAVRVLTDTQEVVVAPLEGTGPTFSGSGGEAAGAPAVGEAAGGGWFTRTFGGRASGAGSAEAQRRRAQQPFRTLANGQQAYPYDVLVVACGARRTLGPLEGLLPNGVRDLDHFGIAVNPGVTRDCLVHTFQGNIVHVKVPPRSFAALVEAERKKGRRPPATALPYNSGEDPESQAALEKLSGLNGADAAATTAEASRAAFMYATSRQHDSTFVSTANLVWQYLHDFNKFNYCQLISVTADADPLGPAPVEANRVVTALWGDRQANRRWSPLGLLGGTGAASSGGGEAARSPAADGAGDGRGLARVVQMPGSSEKTIVVDLPDLSGADSTPAARVANVAAPAADAARGAGPSPARFHFLNNAHITALDMERRLVTLYSHAQNALLTIPYRVLLLDLPLRAPEFLRDSGLARGAAYLQENAALASARSALGMSRSALDAAFDDEASFLDVDPATLQHRRFPNIFGIGDAAGLPTAKGYGATFAQVPVVAHNVMQVLHNQKAQAQREEDEAAYQRALAAYKDATKRGGAPETLQPPAKPSSQWSPPRAANALYDGYSSYHIAVSPWRALWPEMVYSLRSGDGDGDGAAPATPDDRACRLAACNNHLWDNLAWGGPRGCLNAAYYQLGFYENMYFFLFNRGLWYPPAWFSVPTFSPADGTKEAPRRGWLSFL